MFVRILFLFLCGWASSIYSAVGEVSRQQLLGRDFIRRWDAVMQERVRNICRNFFIRVNKTDSINEDAIEKFIGYNFDRY